MAPQTITHHAFAVVLSRCLSRMGVCALVADRLVVIVLA
jgi:hypothetical protein